MTDRIVFSGEPLRPLPKRYRITSVIPEEIRLFVIDEVFANFPECSQSMDCIVWKYKERRFKFRDYEDNTVYLITKDEMLDALEMMYDASLWPKGLTPPPSVNATKGEWEDWICNADADYFDAFLQLACIGEVIYG